ncbi:EAL domain-containing protein [Ramlibacter sp. 2FC]|uniref:EAL domain-containing protein n=1 Tax=Ramlibacter sp. 2FC TaxID=2502188 RepID=UPI001485337B|nr:EAL domain-containing protein [Ramlibacter sp. 2FC]
MSLNDAYGVRRRDRSTRPGRRPRWPGLAAFCLLASLAGTGAAREVRVGVYQNPPKIFSDERQRPAGILVDLLREMATRESWELVFVRCEWQACLEQLSQGRIDLMPDLAYTEERSRRYDFHRTPALHSWSQIYHRAGVPIDSILDLRGKRIALLAGSVQEQSLRAMLLGFDISFEVVPVASLDAAFQLAASGQADAAVANYHFGAFRAAAHQLVETAIVFQPSRLFYVTAPGSNPDLLARIDAHLSAWQQDAGSPYYATLKRWGTQAPQALVPAGLRNALAALAVLGLLLAGGVLLLRRQVRTKTRELQAVNRQLEATLNAVPDLLFEVDLEGRYLDVRATRPEHLAAPAETLLGRTMREVLPEEAANTCLEALREANETGHSAGRQVELPLAPGPAWFELSVTKKPVEAGHAPRFIVLSRDVTDRHQAEQRIRQLAHFDPLTGLPNRTLYQDRFRQALSRAQRHGEPLAVMFLDLDDFRNINNSFGHEVGDQLLREVGHRLQGQLRAEDSAVRVGGDEFVMVLPNTDADGAARTASKLLEAVARPYAIGPHEISESASIGIAMYPQDGTDMDTLSRHADAAMYQVKHAGRNGLRFFTLELQARSARTLRLANALRPALQGRQLALHYLPQLSLVDQHVCGAEALLRWDHPELGAIGPLELVAVAEASGLMLELAESVLRQAIAQAQHWIGLGLCPAQVSVNLSAAQFAHPELPELAARLLAKSGLPAACLTLEITESALLADAQAAIKRMERLAEHGIRVAIDDFGTGYSSVGELKRLRLDSLKIAPSFVRGVGDNPDARAVVCAIVNLARGLGLRTVAEGVESAEQLDFLRRQGCDEAQGYHISPPLPPQAFEAYLRRMAGSPNPA